MDTNAKRFLNWLKEFCGLSHEHKIFSCRCNTDMLHCIKDGVVLCTLLNVLKPFTLDAKDFSMNPRMSQFLCHRNIKTFLNKCKSDFALEDEHLFNHQDSNLHDVLKTISHLSQSPNVTDNIKPFLLEDEDENKEQNTDESTKKCTKEQASYETENQLSRRASRQSNTQTDNNTDEHIEIQTDRRSGGADDDIYQNTAETKIYEDLCSVRRSLQNSEHTKAPRSKRDMCVEELVTTERKYVEALRMIKLFFMNPLKEFMTPHDHRVIFHGVERLWQTHLEFEKDLESSCNNKEEMLVADCFVKSKEKFLFYGDFCSNLTTSQQLLDQLTSNDSKLRVKIQECEMAGVEGRFRLRDLLALPMQRILKYHLFLKEMTKCSNEKPSEKAMLEKALDEIQDLSLFINEVTRDNETICCMKAVQASISNLPTEVSLEKYGRLRMDCEIKVKLSIDNCNKNRHIFLFDMLLIVCKVKNDQGNHGYKRHAQLVDYILSDGPYKEKGMHCVQLTSKRDDNDVIVMMSKKVYLMSSIMQALLTAYDNIEPEESVNSLHHFEMANFGKPTICDVCRKLLRGVFYQGYKCRKTKMAVHKECIKRAKDMEGPPTGSLPPRSFRSVLPSQHSTPRVKALQSFHPSPSDPPNCLSFSVNDFINVVCGRDDEEFMEGELRGIRGLVPKKFVRVAFQSQRSTDPLSRSSSSPLVSPSISHHGGDDDDVEAKEKLHEKQWYAGSMSRDEATIKLCIAPLGTFLVRMSVRDDRKGEFALSIKLGDKVEHLKINKFNGFCFSNKITFASLDKLVEHYREESLESIFFAIKTPLVHDFYSIFTKEGDERLCVALFPFDATSEKQVSFKRGDKIKVLSKAGQSEGWWKGKVHNKVGYFPVSYVKLI